jgi:hypothetical protein
VHQEARRRQDCRAALSPPSSAHVGQEHRRLDVPGQVRQVGVAPGRLRRAVAARSVFPAEPAEAEAVAVGRFRGLARRQTLVDQRHLRLDHQLLQGDGTTAVGDPPTHDRPPRLRVCSRRIVGTRRSADPTNPSVGGGSRAITEEEARSVRPRSEAAFDSPAPRHGSSRASALTGTHTSKAVTNHIAANPWLISVPPITIPSAFEGSAAVSHQCEMSQRMPRKGTTTTASSFSGKRVRTNSASCVA